MGPLNFSTHEKIPCRNVEYIGHLNLYISLMMNWMWKCKKSILGCPVPACNIGKKILVEMWKVQVTPTVRNTI